MSKWWEKLRDFFVEVDPYDPYAELLRVAPDEPLGKEISFTLDFNQKPRSVAEVTPEVKEKIREHYANKTLEIEIQDGLFTEGLIVKLTCHPVKFEVLPAPESWGAEA